MLLWRMLCHACAILACAVPGILHAQAVDPAQPQRVALVIGNSNYPNAPLKNPKNDAAAIAQSLTSIGFKVTTQLDRTKHQIEDDVDAVTDGLKAGDAVLFFYAGHGLELNSTNYLVPVDANVKRKHHVTQRCVCADYIAEAMEGSGASLRVIIFDACRNNPFRSFMRSGKVGLASMQAPEGTIIAYSTAAGTEAADGEGTNSPFAKHFIDTVAADHPRGLEVTDLFRSVARQMKKETGQRAFLDLDASMDHYLLKPEMEIAVPEAPQPAVKKKTIKPFKDYKKLDIEQVRLHAEHGIAAAEAQLGFMYLVGKKPIKLDYKQALAWTKKAADHNNARALNNLGFMYLVGRGVTKDLGESLKYYRRSAAMGDTNGLRHLAMAYEEGSGIEKDFNEAKKIYRKLAEGGDAASQYKMGHMYEVGEGVDIDFKQAFSWYRKSADQGFRDPRNDSRDSLARMYSRGRGTTKNMERAIKWFKVAANDNFPQSQYTLGLLYKQGHAVPLDLNEARRWLKKAADAGVAQAKAELTRLPSPQLP